MRIAPLIVASVVGILLLGGCAADEPIAGDPPIVEPTETPTPTPITALDPAAFATQHGTDGVDFDSPDHNIRCGIWRSYEYYGFTDTGTSAPQTGPLAGCRPHEAGYSTDPSTQLDGNVGCHGGQIFGDLSAEPVCNNGQVFVGEDPSTYEVHVLPVGSSLTYAGVVCTAPDEGTIECVRQSDGAGFTVGRDSYRYF
jgi:hypothetical protein